MFTIRTTAPSYDNPYYPHGIPSEGQCTYGAFYRCAEVGFTPPCYMDRATRTGSYTNAKLWLENYREPWQVKGADYKPVAGDIAVFDGNYGHVVFIERMSGNTALISDWNRVAPLTYASDNWDVTGKLKGVGALKGYLHYPYESIDPVERNINVNQIQTTDDTLRIRTEPSLSGQIVGHVQLGYYNVLQTDKADGYTWYEISKDRWCADITVKYLPTADKEYIRQLEEFLNQTKAKINALEQQNEEMKADMKVIKKQAERWL